MLFRSCWVVRGNGQVRELRWPQGAPDLRASPGVTGYSSGPDGTYVHIDGGAATVSFDAGNASGDAAGSAVNTQPYIAEANGYVRDFRRTPHGLSFGFGGYYQPFVKIANAQSCRVTVAGQPVAAQHDGATLRFDTPASAALQINYQPVEISCER